MSRSGVLLQALNHVAKNYVPEAIYLKLFFTKLFCLSTSLNVGIDCDAPARETAKPFAIVAFLKAASAFPVSRISDRKKIQEGDGPYQTIQVCYNSCIV